jgi:hypothetical protein
MKWRVYYGDGSTFDGVPEDAPTWDVQAIVQPHIESGRYIICLYDYYIYREGRWFGVDNVGAIDYLLHYVKLGRQNPDGTFSIKQKKISSLDFILYGANKGHIKIGRMLRKERFQEIHRNADSDPDFPKRTAYRSNERKVNDGK